jgi:hypothetical protein
MPIEACLSIDDSDPELLALRANGWRIESPRERVGDPDSYRRYIHGSRGEFSPVRPICSLGQSGWFSDRSGCYLAAGRPVVMEDTGLGRHVPIGRGLLTYTDVESAARCLEAVQGDYAGHALAAREFGPWWIPSGPLLAIAGLISLFRSDKPIFWFLSLVIAADLVYCLGYEIAEDKDAYYIPAFIAMTIAAGFGARWFIRKVISLRPSSRAVSYGAIAVVLLVSIGALASNFSYDNRSRYFIAHDYVDNMLSTIEPGGMLLTRDWQVYSPMLYVREIERRRDDTVVIDVNQLRRSWYFDYLDRAFPATIEQARDKVDAF